jgi:5-methylthioribose kinase
MMSLSTPSHDLTTESGVEAYLADTPFASHTIASLSGGSANYTYRIRLSTPYEGQSTLVLKHAEPHVKLEGSTIPFGLERQVRDVIPGRNIRVRPYWHPRSSKSRR